MIRKLFATRSLLTLPVLLAVLVIAAACAAATPETIIIEKEVIREVEKPVIIEKEVIVEREVIKEVPKEVIVMQEVIVIKEVPVEVIIIKEVEVPVIVERQVIKEVEKPVFVEKEVLVETIKEVIVEREVVRIVEVAAKTLPPTPIVTSLWFRGAAPTSYSESPQNAALVNAGQLPAVSQRVSDNPKVLIGPDGVGKYGALARGVHETGDWRNYHLNHDGLIIRDLIGKDLEPNLAASWELTEGGQVHTYTLRKGLKWSDGVPFTSQDFRFAWDVTVENTDYTPNAPSWGWGVLGELPKLSTPDDLTVSWTWPEPNAGFLRMAMTNWRAMGGYIGTNGPYPYMYLPEHILSPYAPGGEWGTGVEQAKLDKMATDAGFDTWVHQFVDKQCWYCINTPEHAVPVIGPWYSVSGTLWTNAWRTRANPYYWQVDSAGNQLPYIQEIISEEGRDQEIISLKLMLGKSDFQRRNVDNLKLTLFKLNETKGKYRTALLPSPNLDVAIQFNLTFDADAELAKAYRNINFRKALSMGIDRTFIQMTIGHGMGEIGSSAPPTQSPYYLGPEYATKFATFDAEAANALLDEMGLDKKDSDGFRLRTDGKGRFQPLLVSSPHLPWWVNGGQMVVEAWRDNLGIDAIFKTSEAARTNESQLSLNGGGFRSSDGDVWGRGSILFSEWRQTQGETGIDPSSTSYGKAWGEIYALLGKIQKEGDYEAGRALTKELMVIHTNAVYTIGIMKANPTRKGSIFIIHKDLKGLINQAAFGERFLQQLFWFDTPSGNREK